MAIYEYQCNNCKKHLEILVRYDEDVRCDECGSTELTRKISSFGFSMGTSKPSCAEGCGGGMESGRCGSGMCCGS